MPNYNFDVPAPEFDSNGYARTNGWVKVYAVDPVTKEYTEARYEFVVKSTGLPAGCYLDSPKQPPIGYAVCRNEAGTAWEFVVDMRGKTCYSKATREPVVINYLGELSSDHTQKEPKTPFDIWKNGDWETDLVAQQEYHIREATQKRQHLVEIADAHITHIKSAVEANDATQEEQESLPLWESYRRDLMRLDTTKAPNIEWPVNNARFRLPGV